MSQIKIGSKYKHYQRKTIYKIIGFGYDSNTLDEVVIYQGQYDSKEFGNNPVWVRPIKEFLEKVIVDGKEVPRFEFIGEE